MSVKLLLVDDEAYVRERLARKIDWHAIGIDELSVCKDSEEAWEILRNSPPDILVTDIRMPKIDGVKLAEEFLYHVPTAKVIFISGYSDVPYLRSAIRLRVVSYVEKPIDIDELTRDIRTAVEEIRQYSQVRLNLEQIASSNKTARQTAIARAIMHEENCRNAEMLLEEYAQGRSYCSYVTVITQILDIKTPAFQSDEEVSLCLSQIFERAGLDVCFLPGTGQLVMHLLCVNDRQSSYAFLNPLFEQLTQALAEKAARCVHAAGCVVRRPSQIYTSYQSAVKKLPRCFYKRAGQLCMLADESPQSMNMEEVPLSAYSHALQKDSSQMIVSLLENLTAQLRFHDGTMPSEVLRFYYAVLMRMYREAEKANIRLSDRITNEYQLLDQLQKFHFLDDLQAFTLATIQDYYERVNNHYTENPVVNKILGYMKQNYADPDMSVSLIAEHMKLSSAYICHLFKDVMGTTIGAYLTRIRIEKAQELIESRRYRVKEVAQMVGYRNGNYFSYKFKKLLGYAPTDRQEE